MSKIFFNKEVSPTITKAKNLPETNAQRVFFSNPLTESVTRLEKQNAEALNALSRLNALMSQLQLAQSNKLEDISSNQQALLDNYDVTQLQMMKEFCKLKNAQEKMNEGQEEHRVQLDIVLQEIEAGNTEVSKLRQAIKEEQLSLHLQTIQQSVMEGNTEISELKDAINDAHLDTQLREIQQEIMAGNTEISELKDAINDVRLDTQLQAIQQEVMAGNTEISELKDAINDVRLDTQLREIQQEIMAGNTEINGLKDAIKEEQLSEQLQHLLKAISEIKKKEAENTDAVLENHALQTLLLEDISRRQGEFGENQAEGLTALIKKLSLIHSENEKSHDTQLQNQKLLVDSLYKLANQQYGLELYME